MGQRQEDHVGLLKDIHLRGLHLKVGERAELWLMLTQPGTCAAAGRHGADFDLGMAEEKAQEFATGVPGRPRYRHSKCHNIIMPFHA